MLRELHISNLAVIADARIELRRGLNCFTGATGAGKSLVIGALEVLLGMRSPAEMLRPGADEGRVSGVFDLSDTQALRRIAELTDVTVGTDGGELLLTRRLYASGRTSASLNGNPITLAMLKQVCESLVDVHGQHDQQFLLKPANQLDVLDQFGGLAGLRQTYRQAYEKVSQARQRIAELTAGRALRAQQLDLYRFQAAEIDSAAIEPGEYEELESRAAVLQNLEKLKREAGATYAALYEADGAVLERLKMMGAILAELSQLDRALEPTARAMRDSTIQLEETAFDLARYLDKLEIDPSELAEVSDRLNTINRILNKYGNIVEATLDYRRDIGARIAGLERATDDFTTLSASLRPLIDDLRRAGEALSSRRIAAAARLGPLVAREMTQLGMDRATFTVIRSPATGAFSDEALPASPSGFDEIEFNVQTNPGHPAQPLRKIASGGELSRIMLALKGILAQGDRISVLVFDEIDANVGGRLGSVIGEKLRTLALHHQVLCITHLPQIASYADRHFTVRKTASAGKTESMVRMIEGNERLDELAEMIGGQHVTATTRAQASELLQSAQTASPPDAVPSAATALKVKGQRRGRAAAHGTARKSGI